MRTKQVLIATALLATILLSGCFGEFALTRKLYNWNSQVGNQGSIDGRLINTVVWWAFNIIPVYGVAGAADALVLNVIEFWQGTNPMAMQAGEIETRFAEIDGRSYEIIATRNRMEIREQADNGASFALVFNPVSQSWNLELAGQTATIASVQTDQLILTDLEGNQKVESLH